ncbi:MAG: hypothetical protein ACP5VE_09825 [Chthonomonadales bacterium]
MYQSMNRAAAADQAPPRADERWARWGVAITIACVLAALVIIAGASPWAAVALQAITRSAGR